MKNMPVKAFKFSALDYLLKPVLVEDLKIAIDKAENQILNELKLQLSSLQLNFKSPKNKTIVLKTMDKIYLVEVWRSSGVRLMDIIPCFLQGKERNTWFQIR